MKKVGLILLSSICLLTACAETKKEEASVSNIEQISKSSSNEVLEKATSDYKMFVEEQIQGLLEDTQAWAETLKAGDLEKAKSDYPIIRMAYERSEPIAESFGESDVKIDFREVDYVEENGSDEGWVGFHRIEKILWTENTTKGTEVYADQLVNDIKELKAKIATIEVSPDLMLTGAVDLLNEVATTKITGEEEIFSHTDLYDFRANIEGAEVIFKLFRESIQEKDKDLVQQLDKEFQKVNELLDQYMTDDKNYKLYTELTKEDTTTLAEAVTKLGEPLSRMGIILE
ncbi:EfeM/EfeO family lipoprotein [Streptococcus minor]|uniref:EfeM/EfeO family lipoprotein n=1 Tax=Streptococcus minor TaxID=229549 RepID=A0A3P1V7Z8_9STRE|nr:iron uptake system protein EfeO [Streptococcus minor]RRD29797.1 EfeM/EfeO family lipoprotein [Streptococcus minor]